MSSSEFERLILSHGHKVKRLMSDFQNLEADDYRAVFGEEFPQVMFVDSYYVTSEYLQQLCKLGKEQSFQVVYIDDVLAFPYDCDFLLNYNIYGEAAKYEALYGMKTMPKLLMGTDYVPLREEFQNQPLRNVKAQRRDILVSTGGADFCHLALDLLKAAGGREGTFHFVIGKMNQDKESLYKLASQYDNVVIHENPPKMSELMKWCDVAISAAGSTLYELCAVQTPTITYVIADNQMPGAERFEELGIIPSCGDVRCLGNEALAQKLVDSALKLAADYDERCRLAKRMRSLVDGNGAKRIVENVLG